MISDHKEWDYENDMETEQQASEWIISDEREPEAPQQSKSQIKKLLICSWSNETLA